MLRESEYLMKKFAYWWANKNRISIVEGLGPYPAVADATEIGWFENTDGGFGPRHPLTDGIEILSSVALGDVDADGLLDLVGSSLPDDLIFQVPGAARGFGSFEILATDAPQVSDVIVADLDGANGVVSG